MQRFICNLLFMLAGFYVPGSMYSQTTFLGSWNVLHTTYKHSFRWQFFAEAQVRSLRFYHHFHYYEYKAGLMWRAADFLRLGAGAGQYVTFSEGGNFSRPLNVSEWRLWPQITLTQPAGPLLLEHRYRLELRFTTIGFRERYRYRFVLSFPLGRNEKGFNSFQVGAGPELFFSSRAPYFERVRLQAHFNYKPSSSLTLQVGYTYQFDYKIVDETGRHFFQTGLYLEIFRQKKPSSPEPDNKDN
jgi:hypothetical protein